MTDVGGYNLEKQPVSVLKVGNAYNCYADVLLGEESQTCGVYFKKIMDGVLLWMTEQTRSKYEMKSFVSHYQVLS